MSSTFFGLEVARSAMQTSQVGLNTIGHNIANAATKGYSRQETVMSTNNPFMTPGMNQTTSAGQVGTGVHVEMIRRMRDTFADTQYRKESKFLGEAEARQRALEQMELIYNEPTTTAIRASIDEFWQSLQDLSVKPEQEPIRTTVRQKALALTDVLNSTYAQLDELRKDNDSEIETVVTEINSLARQISDLNNEIIRVEVSGNQANDYRDRRDLLLDELSKLVGIQTEEGQNGAVSVYLKGKQLVSPISYNQFEIVTQKVDDEHDFRIVRWADTHDNVDVTGGTLKGLIDIRDKVIPDSLKKLDDVATTLAENINTIHSKGLGLDGDTGIDFFVSKDTANVKSISSYVFKNDDLDFTQGTDAKSYAFNINIDGVSYQVSITIPAAPAAGDPPNYSNKDLLDSIKTALAALPTDKVNFITDTVNNQTRIEINSSTPLVFTPVTTTPVAPTIAASTGETLNLMKQLGFTDASGNAKDKITAKDITVSSEIMSSLRKIAAAPKPEGWTSGAPAAGQGGNALAMADIKQTKIRIGEAVTTINDYYNSSISELGILSVEASSVAENKQILLDGLDTRRQSVSGVNQDDEMADMIRYQHGYSAAARMITVLNELFDTIINRMGV